MGYELPLLVSSIRLAAPVLKLRVRRETEPKESAERESFHFPAVPVNPHQLNAGRDKAASQFSDGAAGGFRTQNLPDSGCRVLDN